MTLGIVAEHCYALSFMLSVTFKPFMLIVVVLSVTFKPFLLIVVMLNVVMLSVAQVNVLSRLGLML
jgi:hypothetical protein